MEQRISYSLMSEQPYKATAQCTSRLIILIRHHK